jgi:hypothetical protein
MMITTLTYYKLTKNCKLLEIGEGFEFVINDGPLFDETNILPHLRSVNLYGITDVHRKLNGFNTVARALSQRASFKTICFILCIFSPRFDEYLLEINKQPQIELRYCRVEKGGSLQVKSAADSYLTEAQTTFGKDFVRDFMKIASFPFLKEAITILKPGYYKTAHQQSLFTSILSMIQLVLEQGWGTVHSRNVLGQAV